MKKLFSPYSKLILFFLIFLNFSKSSFSQTLVAGDLAFSGYIFSPTTAGTDEFSFVILKALNAGTTINFTDAGWTTGSGLRAAETTITWTVPAGGLAAGKEIKIVGLTASLAGVGLAGTVSGTALSLNGNNGDQILAYQTTTTIISALHTNTFTTSGGDGGNTTPTVWDGALFTTSLSSSALPTGLSTGVNAIWTGTEGVVGGEKSNAKFVGTGLDLSTVALVRAALNNASNWTISQPQGQPVPNFTLPTNSPFLSTPLPVKLTSFTAKINAEKQVQLNWKVVDQTDIQVYEIQKSNDAKNFELIGTVEANKANLTEYQFLDSDLAFGANYYCLKIWEQNGEFNFSKIVSINFNLDFDFKLFPNPVIDNLFIEDFGFKNSIQGELFDAKGYYVLRISLTEKKPINLDGISKGVYFLRFADGKSYKILK